ncbi:VapE domain-containing protein, partial [Aeromonas caviae]|uniref:VapE domain-containing protein n=1 Tax=Aeromonas caviae TaxID=648 RepID=UPI002B24E672
VSRKDASPQSSASARRIPGRILSGNGVHRFRNHCSTSPEYAAGALKAHITKDVDTFRAPYARSAINKRRQGVFVGTVNDDEFFKDTTGNSRFAVIELTGKISLDAVNDILGYSYDNGRVRQTDREQLLQFWLEVKHWYDTGWSWVLTDSESEHSEANNSRFTCTGSLATTN